MASGSAAKRVKLESSHLAPAKQTLAVEPSHIVECYLARLPPEILRLVLRHALRPSWLQSDMTRAPLVQFPQSGWSADLRVKLVIVRVCSTWHIIGLELLYERITLRRLPQLYSLLLELESRAGLGALVRSLDIDCHVPAAFCASHGPKMKRIFQLCPRLSHFGFSPATNLTTPLFPWTSFNWTSPGQPILGIEICDSLTSLAFSAEVSPVIVLPTLAQLCRNLRSLTLPDRCRSVAPHGPGFTFDKLEDLHLIVSSGTILRPSITQWTMPRLRRVWLRAPCPSCGQENQLPHHSILAPYGRTITFLSLFRFSVDLDGDLDNRMQNLLDSCPALEHLALNASLCRPGPLRHQTLVWVDIFCLRDHHTPVTFEALKEGFPELRTFRGLDETMSTLREIPLTLPSTGSLEVDDGEAESAWITAVLSPDMDSDDSCDEDYELADEGSFVYDSDSDLQDADSDSDSDSDSGSDSGGFDEFYASYAWD
ncbi:hypothetical protein C8R44DRAFT_193502 [Mycena epipterygia]|nr:hypothetical protein C8R44DRAFT_193502 [Mycena epipterygia]